MHSTEELIRDGIAIIRAKGRLTPRAFIRALKRLRRTAGHYPGIPTLLDMNAVIGQPVRLSFARHLVRLASSGHQQRFWYIAIVSGAAGVEHYYDAIAKLMHMAARLESRTMMELCIRHFPREADALVWLTLSRSN